ncbi:Pho cyclin 6/7 [Pelomyxa schiedti]|nr:Pho cyclin 6/7 [Pelomyxa schiedti]
MSLLTATRTYHIENDKVVVSAARSNANANVATNATNNNETAVTAKNAANTLHAGAQRNSDASTTGNTKFSSLICCCGSDEAVSPFEAKRGVPKISVLDYMRRIAKYCPCAAHVFIVMCIYIDRVTRVHVMLTPTTVHRLILAAFVISMKFYSDKYYKNSYNARVGGVDLEELNFLERSMLFMMDFNLVITPEDFQQYSDMIQRCEPFFRCYTPDSRFSLALTSPTSELILSNYTPLPTTPQTSIPESSSSPTSTASTSSNPPAVHPQHQPTTATGSLISFLSSVQKIPTCVTQLSQVVAKKQEQAAGLCISLFNS